MRRFGWVCDEHLHVLGHDVEGVPATSAGQCELCDRPGLWFIIMRAIDEIRAILADRARQQATP